MRKINSARNSGVHSNCSPTHGSTAVPERTLFNHGFSVGLFPDLVSHGLATGHRETVRVVTERSKWLASGLRTPAGGRSEADRAPDADYEAALAAVEARRGGRRCAIANPH